MDINKLLSALNDSSNEMLLNYTTASMQQQTLEILSELHLSRETTLDLFNKLKNYKYIEELSDLKYGTYIRWIPIDDPSNLQLTKGAIFCDYKFTNNGGFCVCKNMINPNKQFQISIEKNLIFQKLTDHELVILAALDHLSK